MVVGAALLAAVTAYHLFDRQLERALEARSQMLVGEAARVLDAGIAAGLEIDQAQLQERALRHVRANLESGEVIAVVDAAGRIVASTNPAEIGERVEERQLVALIRRAAGTAPERRAAIPRSAASMGPSAPESMLAELPPTAPPPVVPPPVVPPPVASSSAGLDAPLRGAAGSPPARPAEDAALLAEAGIVAVRPIQSLFGAAAGHVIARHPGALLDTARQAFIAKASLATAGITLAGLLIAALAAAWLPWRAWRVARAIEATLEALYQRFGTGKPVPVPPGVIPAAMRAELERFVLAVEGREHELQSRAAAVDLLDEAA